MIHARKGLERGMPTGVVIHGAKNIVSPHTEGGDGLRAIAAGHMMRTVVIDRRVNRSSNGGEMETSCFECDSYNHKGREGSEAVCYRCKHHGHHADDCSWSKGSRYEVWEVRIDSLC